MEERIDLIVAEPQRPNGVSYAVIGSMILHVSLVILFIRNYKPVPAKAESTPMARYVELIRQNPKQFTEAPGARTDTAPLNALYSDANRKASTPNPTGDKPTNRPGGGGLYVPPMTWFAQYRHSPDVILLVLASQPYAASDYIRDYESFRAATRARNARRG